MCAICGCDDHHEHVHADGTRHSHAHADEHHHHRHDHGHVELEARVLAKNDALAEANTAWLAERGVLAINLMGAPGCGKTSLLERTLRHLGAGSLCIIEGDQATSHDAERVRAAGAAVVQVNTGTGCHLDAAMVGRGLAELAPRAGSTVVIENVGNLVCPALFHLGERRRAVVLSVAEGDDKPLKYPHMFRAADLVLINKIDLLPHVDFRVARAVECARAVNPGVAVLQVSAKTGEGLESWCGWLRDGLESLSDGREGRVQRPAHAVRVED
ncbi:MAG TPA: hydrogenase nickel incorporation protein HypB [Burkholderiales bacterium]|nr:hydrogenase nickel incorporation protein HypB [Burkholderiales bacterium]